MARGPIKKKPAPKAKGAKPASQGAAKQSWKPAHPMATSPMRQMTSKRPKQ